MRIVITREPECATHFLFRNVAGALSRIMPIAGRASSYHVQHIEGAGFRVERSTTSLRTRRWFRTAICGSSWHETGERRSNHPGPDPHRNHPHQRGRSHEDDPRLRAAHRPLPLRHRLLLYANGFAQIDTRQDASYYGTWCPPATRTIVTFCEGDVTTTVCETDAQLVAQLRELARWNDEAGYGPMKIDAVFHDELRRAFEKLGVADLLH